MESDSFFGSVIRSSVLRPNKFRQFARAKPSTNRAEEARRQFLGRIENIIIICTRECGTCLEVPSFSCGECHGFSQRRSANRSDDDTSFLHASMVVSTKMQKSKVVMTINSYMFNILHRGGKSLKHSNTRITLHSDSRVSVCTLHPGLIH